MHTIHDLNDQNQNQSVLYTVFIANEMSTKAQCYVLCSANVVHMKQTLWNGWQCMHKTAISFHFLCVKHCQPCILYTVYVSDGVLASFCIGKATVCRTTMYILYPADSRYLLACMHSAHDSKHNL